MSAQEVPRRLAGQPAWIVHFWLQAWDLATADVFAPRPLAIEPGGRTQQIRSFTLAKEDFDRWPGLGAIEFAIRPYDLTPGDTLTILNAGTGGVVCSWTKGGRG